MIVPAEDTVIGKLLADDLSATGAPSKRLPNAVTFLPRYHVSSYF